MTKAILYIGHGTRSKQGAEEAKGFLHKVIEKVSVPIQEISFLELTEPFIAEGFERCVIRGATEITVVPIFLLTAGHIKEDIPVALVPLREKFPKVNVRLAEAFGVQERIVRGICELVRANAGEVTAAYSILLVGRGSSDPAIHEAFALIKEGIGEKIGNARVEVCYLAATTPLFAEGIKEISRVAEGRVIVVPYLLFAGLLMSEVAREVKKRRRDGQDIVLIEPLSRHQAILDIVVERTSGKEAEYAAVSH